MGRFVKNIGKTFPLGGFTLAELIVVITVLAILSTIGLLALSGYSQDAKESANKANVRSVYSAISAESALTSNSPRYYVVHDSNAALTGAFFYVDGSPVTLFGGDWSQSGTNYSAGNPDYAKLKINPDKFKISSIFENFSASAAYDPKSVSVGAVDYSTSSTSGGKKRTSSYFQVAGISPATGGVNVTGNYPVGLSGSVSGLVKDLASPSSTGALVDGLKSGIVAGYCATAPSFANVGGLNVGSPDSVGQAWTYSTTWGSCTYACMPGYSGNGCSVIWIAGNDTTGRKWGDGTFATSCKEYLNPTAPKSYSGDTGDGVYQIDPDGAGGSAAYQAYCDMTTDGGGWTLIMMSRENIGWWGSPNSTTISNTPNYDSWSYAAKNASTVNPTVNTTLNVVTPAATTVPFQKMLFRCSGDSTYCGTDNMSIYQHGSTSLLSAKTGTMTKATSTGWPFSIMRMYTTAYTSDPAYYVPINTISLSAQCAPATSRPYSACVRIGIVGRDYYDFQNSIGLGYKGYENYSETLNVNAMLWYMSHRSFVILRWDVFVR